MDLQELAGRLEALEGRNEENDYNARLDEFLGQHGGKFGNDRQIGESFLNRLKERGVDATDGAVEDLLNQLREEVQELGSKITAAGGPGDPAAGGDSMADMAMQAGGAGAAPPPPENPMDMAMQAGGAGAPAEGGMMQAGGAGAPADGGPMGLGAAGAAGDAGASPPMSEGVPSAPAAPPDPTAGAMPPGEVPSDEAMKTALVETGNIEPDTSIMELAQMLQDLESSPPDTLSPLEKVMLDIWNKRGNPVGETSDVTDMDEGSPFSHYNDDERAELDKYYDAWKAGDPEVMNDFDESHTGFLEDWGKDLEKRRSLGDGGEEKGDLSSEQLDIEVPDEEGAAKEDKGAAKKKDVNAMKTVLAGEGKTSADGYKPGWEDDGDDDVFNALAGLGGSLGDASEIALEEGDGEWDGKFDDEASIIADAVSRKY
jgi:hypothetical protein